VSEKGKYNCPKCGDETQAVAVVSSGVSLLTEFSVDEAGKIHGRPDICLIPMHDTGYNKNLIGSYCAMCSLVIVGMYDSILGPWAEGSQGGP